MARKKKTETMKEKLARWAPGYRAPNGADAELCRQEFHQLAADNNGRFDAAQALEFALDENTELHKIPTWDQAKAAKLYNLDEMRRAARSIQVEFDESPGQPSRAFEFDVTQPKRQNGYKPYRSTEDLMKDEEARAALLQRALNDLINCRRKYHLLQELAIVFRAIDEALETIRV